MNIHSSEIACPDCGCREIHHEYDSCYGHDLLLRVWNQPDGIVPTEPLWCYCLRCGVMFDPMKEAFAVKPPVVENHLN